MSALSHIQDYLKARFAGHDIETLMQHFETAIEAKVEEAVAGLRHEIEALREELIPPVTAAKAVVAPEGFDPTPGGMTLVSVSEIPATVVETGSAA